MAARARLTRAGIPMTTESAPRFVIVAGSYADAAPAIRLAEALANARPTMAERKRASAGMGALLGVLVADTMLEAAEGALLVSRPPLRGRPSAARPAGALTREALSAAYASDARAFSARLSMIAARTRLSWDFRTDQGLTVDLACRLRQPDDTLLLGYRRLLDAGGPVVALCHDDDQPTRTLALALARRLRCRAVVLPPETADQPGLIDAMSATALIVAPELAREPARLSALAEAARCPVLVAPDPA